MRIGSLDVCLRVEDVARSQRFYENLGFSKAEGAADEGWVVLSDGECRLGLFAAAFMGDDVVSLNFRGGNIPEICRRIESAGIQLEGPPRLVGEGGGSVSLRDPDGYLIFFDSTRAEAQAYGREDE